MKLYNSVGPNPQFVRSFMAERGISIEMEEVDIMTGVNRQDGYLGVNPAGQLPALLLDDGTLLTEITAICEYLDETHPGESLIGATPEERAQTRRWTRWVDLNVADPLTTAFRAAEGLPMFKDRMRCFPEAADSLKAAVQDKLAWLEGQMDGKTYLTGDKFTMADVLLSTFLAFGGMVGQPLNPDFKNLTAWHERCQGRDSAKA